MTTKGSCACGAIAYQFEGEALTKALCHCIDCQKWTGGAFTSNAIVPRTAFSVTKGTPRTWDAVAASGKINKHFFCGDCGSSLYTELEVLPDVTCVKAGGLDGGAASLDGVINVEYYTKDRVSYLGEALNAEQKTHFG
ncbi:hypothetical protein HYQ45_017190 [Verticillium longisporum]|uniref:DUF636 domain-containing protein n=4 Tax=Verticillium TaxID=1036719 RepID=G2XG85_VERDV|nr:DUF636 domain-containing protein [Verticillium dahliae VdLs.17]KAF3350387.1 hypothetical protein VdG2_01386 [Verticillium dahliae VDG2]KAG7112645.1 hypothetical protein HYQ45_017190 [Verticillium longisporum]KAH6702406.1 DUF636 domain-containing protein [Verticillium dahliae]EGY18712.1 DUF636 domain-containing protein [Verticillium dahliae VdLs.17]PNH36561.1 hypothetical protein BJF96_g269 [Verticillium dahliae]